MDASRVYVGAWVASTVLITSTQTFRRALTALVDMQLRGDKECPFRGVTKSGRVWRKVPESDARSVSRTWCCNLHTSAVGCFPTTLTAALRWSLSHHGDYYNAK